MLEREYTFVPSMVAKGQLFDPLLITPTYSPPRPNEVLHFSDSDDFVISTSTNQLLEPIVDFGVDEIAVDSGATENEDLGTEVTPVATLDAILEPVSSSGIPKRHLIQLHPLATSSKRPRRVSSALSTQNLSKHDTGDLT